MKMVMSVSNANTLLGVGGTRHDVGGIYEKVGNKGRCKKNRRYVKRVERQRARKEIALQMQ